MRIAQPRVQARYITTTFRIQRAQNIQAEGPTGRQGQPGRGNTEGHAGDPEGTTRNPKETTQSPAGSTKDRERSPETARRAPH